VAGSAARGKPDTAANCFTDGNSSQQLFMETLEKISGKKWSLVVGFIRMLA